MYISKQNKIFSFQFFISHYIFLSSCRLGKSFFSFFYPLYSTLVLILCSSSPSHSSTYSSFHFLTFRFFPSLRQAELIYSTLLSFAFIYRHFFISPPLLSSLSLHPLPFLPLPLSSFTLPITNHCPSPVDESA